VTAAVSGVVREGMIAATLTALMILLFLGSWRSTLIIAISIPLSVLASLIAFSALGETINLMTLGGLALAVGILVDDATVTIENIERHLRGGRKLEDGIMTGAGEVALPALVSTLVHLHRLRAMFFLTGVARYLFAPLPKRWYLQSWPLTFCPEPSCRTLVMWFERNAHQQGEAPPSTSRRPAPVFGPGPCGHWSISNKDSSAPSIVSVGATGIYLRGSWPIGWCLGRHSWPFARVLCS